MTYPTRVAGDFTGVAFPTSVEALIDAGAGFLTEAFRATGVLAADNQVTAITGWEEFFGGGMGRKVKLDVAYERPQPGLHTRLFAKFTREFGDPLRELFAPVMAPEVRFALLSRRDDFPVRVPACHYADYHADSQSGLLITERIAYGEAGIEPAHDKCLDQMLNDPLPYYHAQVRAMASLAAHDRAGRFGPEIDRQFPVDRSGPVTRLIPYSSDQLAEKLDLLDRFAVTAPRLLPEGLRETTFLRDFRRDVMLILEKEERILEHLRSQDALIALGHWNMNLDNAWFWRDGDGVFQAGQLDWGGVSRMNLAQAFFGMTCAAEPDFLDSHQPALMAALLADYQRKGGPAVPLEVFAHSVRLAIAVLGTAWMLDAPSLIAAEIPRPADLGGRHDPAIRDRFIPRAQLHLMTVFLNEWRRDDIGATVRAFA